MLRGRWRGGTHMTSDKEGRAGTKEEGESALRPFVRTKECSSL